MLLPCGTHYSTEATFSPLGSLLQNKHHIQCCSHVALITQQRQHVVRWAHYYRTNTTYNGAPIWHSLLNRGNIQSVGLIATEQTPHTMVLPCGTHYSTEATFSPLGSLLQNKHHIQCCSHVALITQQRQHVVRWAHYYRTNTTYNGAPIWHSLLNRGNIQSVGLIATEQTPHTMVLPCGTHYSTEATCSQLGSLLQNKHHIQWCSHLALITQQRQHVVRWAHCYRTNTTYNAAPIWHSLLNRGNIQSVGLIATEQTPHTMVLPSGTHYSIEATFSLLGSLLQNKHHIQ